MYILCPLSSKTSPQSKLSIQFLYVPSTQFQLFDLKSKTQLVHCNAINQHIFWSSQVTIVNHFIHDLKCNVFNTKCSNYQLRCEIWICIIYNYFKLHNYLQRHRNTIYFLVLYAIWECQLSKRDWCKCWNFLVYVKSFKTYLSMVY